MIIPTIRPAKANCKESDDIINWDTVSNCPTEISVTSSAIYFFTFLKKTVFLAKLYQFVVQFAKYSQYFLEKLTNPSVYLGKFFLLVIVIAFFPRPRMSL